MFSHTALRWSTSAALLLTLALAEFDGQVRRDGDVLLPQPRSIHLSALNGSSAAFPGNGQMAPPKDDDVYPESWISDLFYRALANFTIQRVGSSACQRQVDMYVRNLRNFSDWAVRSELTRNMIITKYYSVIIYTQLSNSYYNSWFADLV